MGFVTAIQNYINYHVLIFSSLFVKHRLKPKMDECMKHHVHHVHLHVGVTKTEYLLTI